MTISTDTSSPIVRAETAAALAMRNPRQSRDAFRIYLAEIISGAISKKHLGVRLEVFIAHEGSSGCVCSVAGLSERPDIFHGETLSDLVGTLNAKYLSGNDDQKINYKKAYDDFELLRKRISSQQSTTSEIAIVRR